MKKILSIIIFWTILCSALSGSLFSVSARPAEPAYKTSGDYNYRSFEDGTANIIKYRGSATEVVIPYELDGRAVTGFDVVAFNSSESVESLIIPDTITNISGNGFVYISEIIIDENNKVYDSRENCNAIIETETNTMIAGCLNTVIPDSVTSIGEHAFCGCSGLTSIVIPNSVTDIGKEVFSYCQNLESISIAESVTSIDNNVFNKCISLSEIKVDKSNKVYDSRENCNAIIETKSGTLMYGCMNTVIPDDVTYLAAEAFSSCEGLTSITIPASVASIGDSVFEVCTSLKTVVIEEGVESIEVLAFNGCKQLTSVTIPKSVTEINRIAFYECKEVCLYVYEDSYAHEYAQEEKLNYEIIASDEKSDVSTMDEVDNEQVDTPKSDSKKILLCIAVPTVLATIVLCVIVFKKKRK